MAFVGGDDGARRNAAYSYIGPPPDSRPTIVEPPPPLDDDDDDANRASRPTVVLPPPPLEGDDKRPASSFVAFPPPPADYNYNNSRDSGRSTFVPPPPADADRPTFIPPPPASEDVGRPTVVEPPPPLPPFDSERASVVLLSSSPSSSAPPSPSISPCPSPSNRLANVMSFIGPPPDEESVPPPPPVDTLQVMFPGSGKITIPCSGDTSAEQVEQKLLKQLAKRGLSSSSPGVAEWLQALLYAWTSKTMRRVEYGPVSLWQWTPPPQADEAEGKEPCTRCRAILGFSANFCTTCGLAAPETAKETPKQNKRAVKLTPDMFKCESCNVMLAPRTRFCSGCGVAVVEESLAVWKAINDVNEKTFRYVVLKLTKGHGVSLVKGGSRLSGKFAYNAVVKELVKGTRPGFLAMDYHYAIGGTDSKCLALVSWLPQTCEVSSDSPRFEAVLEFVRNRLKDFPQRVVWLNITTPEQLNEDAIKDLCN